MSEQVSVAIHIEVDGVKKEFSTTAQTSGDPHRVADGLMDGLHATAGGWLSEQRYARERAGRRFARSAN
jgi:hypothetical protein